MKYRHNEEVVTKISRSYKEYLQRVKNLVDSRFKKKKDKNLFTTQGIYCCCSVF